MTGSFYVDGPSEIDFNQTIKTNLEGAVEVGTPGNTNTTRTFGDKQNTSFGGVSTVTLGKVQDLATKRIDFGAEGIGRLSSGSTEDFGIGRFRAGYVGAPFPNMIQKNVYDLKVGGTVETSYNLTASSVQTTAPVGLVDTAASVYVSQISSIVLLN